MDHDHSNETYMKMLGIDTDDKVIEGILSGEKDNILNTLASPYYLRRGEFTHFRSKVVIEALVPALKNPESDLPMLQVALMSLTVNAISKEAAEAVYPGLKQIAEASDDPWKRQAFTSHADRLAERYPGGKEALEAAISRQ